MRILRQTDPGPFVFASAIHQIDVEVLRHLKPTGIYARCRAERFLPLVVIVEGIDREALRDVPPWLLVDPTEGRNRVRARAIAGLPGRVRVDNLLRALDRGHGEFHCHGRWSSGSHGADDENVFTRADMTFYFGWRQCVVRTQLGHLSAVERHSGSAEIDVAVDRGCVDILAHRESFAQLGRGSLRPRRVTPDPVGTLFGHPGACALAPEHRPGHDKSQCNYDVSQHSLSFFPAADRQLWPVPKVLQH